MYRLCRKMTINGHFSIYSIYFCLDTTLMDVLRPKLSSNEMSYKEVPVLLYICPKKLDLLLHSHRSRYSDN